MIPISKPVIGKEEIAAVNKVLESGNLVQGKVVKEFEKQFAKYIGVKESVAVSSGTAALQVGLEALNISGEVITTPFTFIASSNSILYVGCKPVFADINPNTFNIDPESIRKKITRKTKAILIVHLYGQPCEMDEIADICRKNDLLLIEDCAQACGAEYNGEGVGSFGDLATFSFYPTKNMTTGEGGAILAKDEGVLENARMIRHQGQRETYEHEIIGYNYRMTEMQAAIGLVQLKKLDRMNEIRIKIAEAFSKGVINDKIELPVTIPKAKHVWHQYTIKTENRDYLMKYLEKNEIQSKVFYPKPIYLQPPYKKMGYPLGCSPTSEKLSKYVLSIPVHPSLIESDVGKIIKTLNNYE